MFSLAFLSSLIAVCSEDKTDPTPADRIVWGKVFDGLQLGIFPDAGTDGLATKLFDGKSLQLNVQVRNAGKSAVRFLPSTFGCAALGPDGAIPVTKLILTPSGGGEPISITYQGHNHLSDTKPLDEDDLDYFTTELASGDALRFPYHLEFTPGEDRSSTWQRVGKSNIVPEGKYQLKAVFAVDQTFSQWKGELTSGSLEVNFQPSNDRRLTDAE